MKGASAIVSRRSSAMLKLVLFERVKSFVPVLNLLGVDVESYWTSTNLVKVDPAVGENPLGIRKRP